MNHVHVSPRSFYRYYWDRVRELGLLSFCAVSVTALWNNPRGLIGSLWNCRVLARGDWAAYESFSAAPSFMKLFYRTQNANLRRHGLQGISPTLGAGNFALRRFWYHSPLGLRLHSKLGGVVTALLGMGVWWVSHVVWLSREGITIGAVGALLLVPCTTNFLGNLFIRQTYSAFSWAFFPLALWATLQQQYLLAGIFWFLVASFHIGNLAFGTVIAGAAALLTRDPLLALVVVPSWLPFFWRSGLLNPSQFRQTLRFFSDLLGALGGKRQVKYLRPTRWLYVVLYTALLFILPFAVASSSATVGALTPAKLALLSALPAVWFFFNQARILRIADTYSLFMLYLSLSLVMALLSPTLPLLVVFWVTNTNALIALQLYRFDEPLNDSVGRMPTVAPLDLRPYEQAVDRLLAPVPAGETLFLAFADPGNNYNLIFDGYSDLYQLLQYRADKKGIHVLPDWYFLSEYNCDTPVWGREGEAVRANLAVWKARSVLAYEQGQQGVALPASLKLLSTLDWRGLAPELKDSPVFSEGFIEWRLYENSAG